MTLPETDFECAKTRHRVNPWWTDKALGNGNRASGLGDVSLSESEVRATSECCASCLYLTSSLQARQAWAYMS